MNATKQAVRLDNANLTFAEWRMRVLWIMERSGDHFTDYELEPCYRDGMTPKQAVRWLLGYDE